MVPIYVDCSSRGQNQDLLERYGVRSLPTILILDPQGEVLASLGLQGPQSYVQAIEAAVEKVSGE